MHTTLLCITHNLNVLNTIKMNPSNNHFNDCDRNNLKYAYDTYICILSIIRIIGTNLIKASNHYIIVS